MYIRIPKFFIYFICLFFSCVVILIGWISLAYGLKLASEFELFNNLFGDELKKAFYRDFNVTAGIVLIFTIIGSIGVALTSQLAKFIKEDVHKEIEEGSLEKIRFAEARNLISISVKYYSLHLDTFKRNLGKNLELGLLSSAIVFAKISLEQLGDIVPRSDESKHRKTALTALSACNCAYFYNELAEIYKESSESGDDKFNQASNHYREQAIELLDKYSEAISVISKRPDTGMFPTSEKVIYDWWNVKESCLYVRWLCSSKECDRNKYAEEYRIHTHEDLSLPWKWRADRQRNWSHKAENGLWARMCPDHLE